MPIINLILSNFIQNYLKVIFIEKLLIFLPIIIMRVFVNTIKNNYKRGEKNEKRRDKRNDL